MGEYYSPKHICSKLGFTQPYKVNATNNKQQISPQHIEDGNFSFPSRQKAKREILKLKSYHKSDRLNRYLYKLSSKL